MAAIFYEDEESRKLAGVSIFKRNCSMIPEASKAAQEEKIGKLIQTQVLPIMQWTDAEDYHQKYYLRHSGIIKKMKLSDADLLNSTVAARLNAGVHGNGDMDAIIAEVNTAQTDENVKQEIVKSIQKKFK